MARMGLSACVALLVACGGGATNANAPEPPSSVVLVSDGTEPRRLVQLDPPLHVPEMAEFNVKTRARNTFVNTVLETGHKDIDFPTVKSTVRIEALGVTPSGELVVQSDNVDISILDDVVDPRVRAMMAKQAQHMKGTRTSWRMKRGGDISDMQVTPATAFPVESYGESVRFFTPRFPDVPIGIGSEWRLQRQVTSSRIKWNVSATYRLREVDDTRAILDVALDMKAGEQALSVEPNATTTLKSATGHVTGTVTVPLHGLAFEGEGHVTTETRFLIVQGHLRITSTVESATLMTSKPVHM